MGRSKQDAVDGIQFYFRELRDPRSSVNLKHRLGDLIVICIMAVIAGADGPTAIGTWARCHEAWLVKRLGLQGPLPSHDTLGRLLCALKPTAFQSCFASWLASLGPEQVATDAHQIAIDGKVLRRSHDRSKGLGPLWLVSAWSVDRNLSLGQLATDEKSNEITAIPELLATLDLKKAVVTIDAAGCQKAIAKEIVQGGGDYVLALKGNQKSLHDDVANYLIEHMDEPDLVDTRQCKETLIGHGRTDEITYCQMPVPADLPNREKWRGLKTIGVAIRQSTSNNSEKSSVEVRFYIASIGMGVKKFARYVRGHWAIENTCHWCLDVTFREDESRLRNRNAANNLAWLKRFAISILKQKNDKNSVAMRRRMAGWNTDYLAQVLGIKGT